MVSEEITYLKTRIGKVIQLEGFVSTSLKRKKAVEFLEREKSKNVHLFQVLLIINVGITS